MSDVTRLLDAVERGGSQAAEDLLPLVYEELRRLAAAKMANEKPGQTLQPTALVHEAWLRLMGGGERDYAGRMHFFAVAAEAMRRILVDRARQKARPKHGGDLQRADVQDTEIPDELPPEQVLAVDEALNEFQAIDPQAAELIKLRFFAGFTQEEAAKSLGISRSTADRNWVFARAWLFKAISGPSSPK